MSVVLSAKFRIIDEMSVVLNNIGRLGNSVIAGLESSFGKLDSDMQQTAKNTSNVSASLSELSGDTAGMSAKSRELSNSLSGESENLRRIATNLQIKADRDERAADAAQKHYEKILEENSAAEKVTSSMQKNAESARLNAEEKRKAADASRQEADAAEKAVIAKTSDAKAVEQAVQGNQRLSATLAQTTDSQNKIAESFNNSGREAAAYSNAVKNAATSTTSLVSPLKSIVDTAEQQAVKLESAAQKAKEKASADREAAEKAKEYHTALKEQLLTEKQISREETTALTERVNAAKKLADEKEKQAQKSEKIVKSVEAEAAAARTNTEELRKNAQIAEENARAKEKLIQDTNKLANSENQAANAINSSANAENKAADSFNKSGKAAEEYARSVKKAGDESEQFGQKGGDAISKIEQLLAGTGIALALGKIKQSFTECSEEALGFEKAVAKVSTIADLSVMSVGEIDSGIMDLSRQTGRYAADIAEANYQAISASVGTADSLKFVEQAGKLAAGGFTQQATAADVLTTAINSYKLTANDAVKISDMLITTQNLGKTTVEELAQSMGRVIPLAATYGVELDNLSTGYALLTKNGIATARATTYMSSMLNELGKSGSKVSDALENETGKTFAKLMQDGRSLYDVMEILGRSVNNDATAFSNLWGSQEAGISALTLFNAGANEFNKTLEAMQNSTGATAKACEIMGDTTAKAQQRMQNSFTNLQITVGSQLNPAIKQLYNFVANVTDSFSDFVGKHPAIMSVLVGTATALGVAAAAFAVYTAATKVASIATNALTASMVSNPIIAVAAAISALGIGVAAFVYKAQKAENAVEDYNGTLEECRAEIDETQSAYDSVCKKYGETSEAAKRLSSELDTLNAQYKKGGGYAAELEQEVTELSDAYKAMTTEINDAYDSISKSETSGYIAVAQLESLSEKAQITNSDLDMMSKYADYLNDTFNCNIEVNYDTKEITGFDPEIIAQSIIKDSENKKIQVSMDALANPDFQFNYVDAYRQYREASKKLAPLKSQYETLTKASPSDAGHLGTAGDLDALAKEFGGTVKEMTDAFNNLEMLETKLQDADSLLKTHADIVDDTGATYGFLKESLEKAAMGIDELEESAEKAKEALTPEEAISEAWNNSQEAVTEFGEKVVAITAECRENLDSMFALFEKAEMNTENALSLDGAVENLQSQIDYFNQYREALAQLSELEISDEILSQLNPEQAVAFANELEGMDADAAKAKVNEINSAFDELDKMKDKTADAMTKVQEEFDRSCDELQKKLETALNDMDMPEDAAESAKSTMDGYIGQLRASGGQAIQEARNIANQITAALSNVSAPSVSVPTPSVYGPMPLAKNNYVGAVSASAGYALVGEKGMELVKFSGGERVYTHEETVNILNNHEIIPQLWDNAYEKGTKSAQPGVALVGEKGPELVVMQGGERVYTAAETNKIVNSTLNTENAFSASEYKDISKIISISSPYFNKVVNEFDNQNPTFQNSSESYLDEKSQYTAVYDLHDLDSEKPFYMPSETAVNSGGQEKGRSNTSRDVNINVKIDGKVTAQSGTNENEIVSIIIDNLKPALIQIVNQEIFEEGENSYET